MTFWMFIAVIVGLSLANGAFRHYQTQQTIRKAIEKGDKLDPETLERIVATERPKAGPARPGLIVGGLLMLSIGAGLMVIGWSMSHVHPDQLYEGLGAGAMVGLIGVGMLTGAALIGRNGKAPE
jgi:hypothetical protein